jgi:hypothetical protein
VPINKYPDVLAHIKLLEFMIALLMLEGVHSGGGSREGLAFGGSSNPVWGIGMSFGWIFHKHLDVDVTVISAHTNCHVPAIGAQLPLHGSLTMVAQQG